MSAAEPSAGMTAPAADLRSAIGAAARWYVVLSAETAGEAERLGWEQWLAASPLHKKAWAGVEGIQSRLARIPDGVGGKSLRNSDLGRREVLRRLGVLAVGAPLAAIAWRSLPWNEWRADYSTTTGERRRVALADGTSLALDTRTAVNVAFSAGGREIRLVRGEILVEVAAAEQGPVVVKTAEGEVLARDGRFTVRSECAVTQVAVLDSSAAVAARGIPLCRGEQLRFTAATRGDVQPAPSSAGSWLDGSLVVVDMPLGHLLEELGRYRPGLLQCAPEVAGLRISGAFPLDDIDKALELLTETFPVRQQRVGGYWVRMVSA